MPKNYKFQKLLSLFSLTTETSVKNMGFILPKINKSFYHAFMIIWFMSNVLITVGSLTGKIRFGLGLGDLIYIGVVGLAVIIAAIYYYIDFRVSGNSLVVTKRNLLVMACCLIFLLYIILKMTYWRDWESKWDGRIFF